MTVVTLMPSSQILLGTISITELGRPYGSKPRLSAKTFVTSGLLTTKGYQIPLTDMSRHVPEQGPRPRLPELLAIAWQAIEHGGCDFLGSVASQMEVLNARIGQFFTPYTVSRMIAEMSLQDIAPIIEANGFVTISEPACGAGGMVLAAADVLQKQGLDIGTQMLVNAVDISPL